MDKDKVWQTLHDHIQPPKVEDLTLEIEDWRAGLGMAAEIIAAQHEQEMDKLRASIQNLLKAADRAVNEKYEALLQVAVMRILLSRTLNVLSKPSLLGDDIVRALSAAPKVAWSGTMYVGEDSIGPVLMDPDPKCPWPKLMRGQQVMVFVECPPKGEQLEESEQGKEEREDG